MKLFPLIGLVPLTLGVVIALDLVNPLMACLWICLGVVILADLPKPPIK